MFVAAVFVAIGAPMWPAPAAPGNPGVPSPPTVLYAEDFENQDDSAAHPLPEYSSVDGITYTADDWWLDTANCNGFIVSRQNTQVPGFCANRADEWDKLTAKADALAQLNGTDRATNSVLATNTTGGTPTPNGVMLRSLQGIPSPAGDRFVAVSVNMAASATTCRGNEPPLLLLSLVDANSVEHPTTLEPINLYTDPRGQEFTGVGYSGARYCVIAGTFYSDQAMLVNAADLRLVLRNASTAAANGNDGAIDDVRIVDVTPQLDKTFTPASVPVNGVSTLTFTVTNRSDLGEKNGWSFTDTLPAGLVLADPVAVGGDCDATTVANPGESRISVTDGVLAAGQASCTITVNVTSATPSGAEPSPVVYENCPADLTDVVGLDLPACATVEFHSVPELAITKTSDAVDARQGDTVTYTVTATNVGSGDYTAAAPAVVTDDLTGVLDDGVYNDDATADAPGDLTYAAPVLSWTGPLKVGDSVTVTYTVTLGSGGDGVVRNVACEPCVDVVTELPRLTVTKAADRTELPKVGERVTYTVTATNAGPGDYTAAAPAVVTDDLSATLDDATYEDDAASSAPGDLTYAEPVLTWSGPLAAGESVTITYSVTYTGKGDGLLVDQACVPETQTLPGAEPCALVTVPAGVVLRWKEVDASSDPVVAGTVLTYTLHFLNTGHAAAELSATDYLTDVLDDAAMTTEPTATGGLLVARAGDVLTVHGTLASGAAATVVYQVTVLPDGRRGDDVATNFVVKGAQPPPETCEPADPERPNCTVTPIEPTLPVTGVGHLEELLAAAVLILALGMTLVAGARRRDETA